MGWDGIGTRTKIFQHIFSVISCIELIVIVIMIGIGISIKMWYGNKYRECAE